MPFCRRRAYVEFTGKDTVVITTYLNQKRFPLTDDCTIDLTNLKKEKSICSLSNPPSGFYINFVQNQDTKEWHGTLCGRVKPDKTKRIGDSDCYERNKRNFKFNVWYED